MTEFYSNGTVALTNGSPHVVAEDPAVWIAANVKKGDMFLAANTVNVIVEDPVFNEDSSTYSLELGLAFGGDTATGVAYIIVKTSAEWGTNRTLSLQTAELIQGYAVGAITETQLNEAVAAAEAAQGATEAAAANFNSRYLTPKVADPVVDDNGDPLVAGQIYLNLTSGLLRIYSGTAWSNMLAGQQGLQGVGAGLQFNLMTATIDADPGGPGNARLNATDRTTATKLWLDNTDINNAPMTGPIDSWDDSTSAVKGVLYIWNRANRAQFLVYNVTGAVVDKTGYREVPLAYVGGGTGAIANATQCELVFIPAGNKGDTGAAGQTAGVPVAFSTTITDADPGNGKLRSDSATFLSIANLFIDNQDANAVAITAWLDSLDDVTNANTRGYLRAQKPTDPSVWMEFAVVGAVTDGGGYRKVPVSPISGAVPADATPLVLTFAPAGKDGLAGTDGGDPGILFNFDTSTADSNPTAGGIRANNATLTSSTVWFVSKTARAGNDISTFLATLAASSNPTIKGTVVVSRPSDGEQVAFNITGLTDAAGYIKLAVSDVGGATAFANNDPVSFQFTRTGNQGTSGDGTGDFNGPDAAVDGNLVAYDGTTGKLGKDSGKALADLVLSDNNLSDLDDKQAAIDNLSLKGANIASAATVNLDTVTGQLVHVTGNTATSAITLTEGRYRRVIADGAWPLTAGTNLVLNNGGASYTCSPGDQLDVYSDGTKIRVSIIPVSGSSPAAMPAGYLDTDGALTANSDTKVASQKAVKTYVDGLIAAQDAMVFKGVVDCSTNPNYPAADRGWTYRVSVAGKIGGASGANVEAGDVLLCLTDGTNSGNQATVGAAWSIIQTNIDGGVISTRQVVSGGGLTGGGDLSADRTLAVGAGTGIVVNADDVAVDKATAANLQAATNNKVVTADIALSAMAFAALTDAATVVIDHAAGVNRKLTIAGNRAMGAPSNGKPGWPLNILVTQDGTGGRQPTWNSVFKFGPGGAPTLGSAAGAKTLVCFVCADNGTDYIYLGSRAY